MAELFSAPGIMALPIMLRPACRRRESAALFALAAKFARSDVFGQAREIGWLLVFDGSGSHFVKATVILEWADRIDCIPGFKRRIVSSKFQTTIASG